VDFDTCPLSSKPIQCVASLGTVGTFSARVVVFLRRQHFVSI
jgi:hypothetical protein